MDERSSSRPELSRLGHLVSSATEPTFEEKGLWLAHHPTGECIRSLMDGLLKRPLLEFVRVEDVQWVEGGPKFLGIWPSCAGSKWRDLWQLVGPPTFRVEFIKRA